MFIVVRASARCSSSPSRCSARSPSCRRCSRKLGDKRREGPRPVHRPSAAASRRRVAHLGRDPRPRPARARSSRSSLAGGLLVALAIPALGMQIERARASTACRSDLPIMQTYDRIQAAFPGGPLPRRGRRQGRRRHRARRSQAGDRASSIDRRSPPASCPSRSTSTSARTRPSRSSTIPIERQRHRRRVRRARSTTLRDDVDPGHGRQGRRRRGRRDRHDRRLEGLQRPDEARACRSCSRSCSALAFLLLLVTFRSIVIPIKAIVLNLLSVGAAYGVLVAGLPGRPRRERCSASSRTAASRPGCRCSCS